MISSLESLETKLNEVFVKRVPALPPDGKKTLVNYLPWINLLLGLLSLYVLHTLWHWAHTNPDYISGLYAVPVNHMSLGIWLGVIALAAEALFYIAAFSATRGRKKSGWNLMFYALLINVIYGVVILFTDYGSISSLLTTLIDSAVGLYLLFQIRDSYLKKPARRKKTA